jgi:hypothetical protein
MQWPRCVDPARRPRSVGWAAWTAALQAGVAEAQDHLLLPFRECDDHETRNIARVGAIAGARGSLAGHGMAG